MTNRLGHQFGGDWTTRKLAIVSAYLSSYTTALKNAPFETLYIDAFAGTGYRMPSRRKVSDFSSELFFPDLSGDEPQSLLAGSARQALLTQPAFNTYLFVERNAGYRAELTKLVSEFPDLAERIQVVGGDANEELQKLCQQPWRRRRAVLFLDPYGMQVEWSTLEAIAATKAIDLWLLFPLGIGVNRLLTRSAEIPEAWRHRLDLLLGTTEWFDEFYRVESEPNLFGDADQRVIKASMATIGRYFVKRLGGIFSGVLEDPAVLCNSTNNPLYLLCFAVGNEKGKPIALRIARHLLGHVP